MAARDGEAVPEFSDTDPRALEVFLSLQRRMTPGEKVAAVFQLSNMVLRLAEAGVRKLYPNAGEAEVLMRVAARHLDRDLVIRAYGWDPEDDRSRERF
ncbi:MAG: hypothetical protein M1541_06540 [Acidobacteria bacterium]|nr:hypothetical protein [Acidobacteriota bacterium]